MTNIRLLTRCLCLALLATLLPGCDRGGDSAPEQPATAHTDSEAPLTPAERQRISQMTMAIWQEADSVLAATRETGRQLDAAIAKLLAAPSAETLRAAQDQWRETALSYQAFHLYESLAELQPEQFQLLGQLTFNIAARPIQPGYLDNFGPYTYSGLVHDIGIPITPETLREQHGMTDAQDATLGIYALQFMLFGYSDAEPREAADFRPQTLAAEQREQGFNRAEELPENRRRQLIEAQVQLLVEDLQQLYQLWQPGATSIHGTFTARPPRDQHVLLTSATRLELSKIITGLSAGHSHEPSEAASPDAALDDTSFANQLPVDFWLARLQQAHQLAQILQLNVELQQNLDQGQQLLKQIESGKAAKATREKVIAILAQTLNMMAEGRDSVAR